MEQDKEPGPSETYDEVQEQEQHEQEVPPEAYNEIQEQQVPQEINDEIQEEQEQQQPDQEEQAQFPPKLVFDQDTKGEYHLTEPIGTSFNGVIKVHRAAYFLRDFNVLENVVELFFAVMTIRAIRESPDYNNIRQRIERNRSLPNGEHPHPNILGIESVFTDNGIYCIVFPCVDGSLRSLMRSKFPDGIPQEYIVVVLREALKGLHFLHQNHQVHGEVSAGQIFYTGTHIQLSFGTTVYDHGTDEHSNSGYLPTKHISTWACAPEVNSRNNGLNNPKTDIWMIGITALELACGEVQIRNKSHFMSTVNAVKQRRRILPLKGDQSLSPFKRVLAWFNRLNDKSTMFDKFVCNCLATNPAKRPTADQLLNSELFTKTEKEVEDFHDLLQ